MAQSNISKAYEILKTYKGDNNQIKYYKSLYEQGKLILEDFAAQYIVKNHEYQPIVVNRIVKISQDFGKVLSEKYNLSIIPTSVFIVKIIGEMGHSYHTLIKTKVTGYTLIYIKKRYVLDKLETVDLDTVDIDFDYYDNMPSNGGRKLKEHQKIGVKFLVGNKKCILADDMGCGKMQDVLTPIPTPNGTKTLGDLQIGDKIYGSDGNVHNVIGIFNHRCKDLYNILFSDGSYTNSGLEHLWIVKDIEDKTNEYKVLSLEEIILKGLFTSNDEPRFEIPLTQPIEKDEAILDVDIYQYVVTSNFDELDLELLRSVENGSIQQRMDLLKGFVDKYGSLNEDDKYLDLPFDECLGTTFEERENIIKTITLIVESLGGIAIPESPKDVLRLHLNYPPYFNQDKVLSRKIIGIDFYKNGDARCIKVDSPDESYLTNDYIVTHNTTQSIVAALAGGYKKILIITTASLKTGWKKDLVLYEKEDNICIVNGNEWTPGKKFTIINYDIIDNFYKIPEQIVYETETIYDNYGNVVEVLRHPKMVTDKKGNLVPKKEKSRKKADIQKCLAASPLFLEDYDCVIIDEAQKLSNKTSIRYKVIQDFLVKANPKGIFLLTGTPLTNNPMNLYNILRLIDAEVTWDYKYYVERYCGGIEHTKRDGHKYWTFDGDKHLDELRDKIKNVYIRRLASETGEMVKKEVTRKYYNLTASEKEEYDRLWEDYQSAQEESNEDYRTLIEGGLVRQFLAKTMTKHTIELVDEMVEDGEKVVIITCFNDEMDILKKHFGKQCVTFNGSMTSKQKDKAQDSFNNDPNIKVFIGQIIATSVGLNLPIARKLVFNSYDWVAANNIQCESRIHRLTQTQDVECIYQLFNDSISQEMFDKVIYKQIISDQIIKSENQKNTL